MDKSEAKISLIQGKGDDSSVTGQGVCPYFDQGIEKPSSSDLL